ncbi:hypothetical protein SCMU_32760 [Sinomonas cyclohexanicum]|uniref:Uncharacterized protein n=1 Tax=Sinomonas cyclohexanicum TaxID=322009 RepID=A0ABN6FL38_SINCY|nr:hypothetical protein [Corynebacterium cyclohexanicum]BCT77434.1 hypothetical protein SCMU_32760 [Corynebacterium cyclohexanicum]
MSTVLDDLLAPRSAASRPAVFIDHTAFGGHRILRGPIPWTNAAELAGYYGKAQALLGSDATVVPVALLVDAVLAENPSIRADMAARPRPGYALRTLLAADPIREALSRALAALPHASRAPIALLAPSPLVWLALAQRAAGNPDVSGITADHAEAAAMYVSDWLRHVADRDIAFLVLDGSRDLEGDPGALERLPEEDLAAYAPVANAAEHYRWGLIHVADGGSGADSSPRARRLPEGYWTDDAAAPEADILLARVPADADPETVLARLAALR